MNISVVAALLADVVPIVMNEKSDSPFQTVRSPLPTAMPIGPGIADWVNHVRHAFARLQPDLLSLFDTYAGEAVFGRGLIDDDLVRAGPRARVLEIGAGAGLLSGQLVREGYRVTALEPSGCGFSHFDRMRELVVDCARSLDCVPILINIKAENISEIECYDYAFSINVMEHVDDPELVIRNAGRSLVRGGTYHFTCPNYLFPYEPHFNIPTLISKPLTEWWLRRQIFSSPAVVDPEGTWRTLNWINVLEVRRFVSQMPGLRLRFNRKLLFSTVGRIVTDKEFAGRRSPAVRAGVGAIVWMRLHYLLLVVPAWCQPVMDCFVEKRLSVRDDVGIS